MPSLQPTTVLRRKDVVWREVAGELVVLDPDGSVILGLNGTGGEVWKLLDGVRTLAEVAGALADTHGVPPDQAHGDVMAFARVLVDRKLVT